MPFDFLRARQKAYDHLTRFFTVERLNKKVENGVTTIELWEVELEIDSRNSVICLPVTVAFEEDFPFSLPQIYINKRLVADLGFPPGISANGLICTFDKNTNIPNPEKPEFSLEACIRQAKRIIESGLKGITSSDYDQEFIAYWENTYLSETSVDTEVLSLIRESDILPEQIIYVSFKRSVSGYRSAIYSKPEEFQSFKCYLISQGISFRETPTFYLGVLKDLCPPFSFSYKDVWLLITKSGLAAEFDKYLKSGIRQFIVTFTKIVNNRNLVFGWKYKFPVVQSGRRNKRKRRVKRLSQSELQEHLRRSEESVVARFSPQIFTPYRMRQRTSADYAEMVFTSSPSLFLAGLGSIGANLIPLFESCGVYKFRLADDDYLSIDNIARHLLGFSDVGKYKVDALRDYILFRNPHCHVEVRKQKVVQLFQTEPTFVSDCDYHIFCTGDVNAETWIAQNLRLAEWGRPSFFVWVEPYLAGGHCVYLTGEDEQTWDSLFIEHRFIWNVIPSHIHDVQQFTKREAGCQVSYTPYAPFMVKSFLTSLFPHIVDVIMGKSTGSRVFSWTGDIDALQRMNIPVSDFISTHNSFTVVERLLC